MFQSVGRILRWAKGYQRRMILGFVCSFFATWCTAGPVMLAAWALGRLIGGYHGHVNLIPVNPIKERDYVQSNREAVEAFKRHLEKRGINVTVRREMGRDISAACGQLRKGYKERSGNG